MPRIGIDLADPHSFSLQNPIQSTKCKIYQTQHPQNDLRSNIILASFSIATKPEISCQF